MIHGVQALEIAKNTSEFLFGDGSIDILKNLNDDSIFSIFAGIPKYNISSESIASGINIVDLLAVSTKIFNSKSEVRRMIANKGLYLNKEVVDNENLIIDANNLIKNKFLIVQKGKKNYFLIIAE